MASSWLDQESLHPLSLSVHSGGGYRVKDRWGERPAATKGEAHTVRFMERFFFFNQKHVSIKRSKVKIVPPTPQQPTN